MICNLNINGLQHCIYALYVRYHYFVIYEWLLLLKHWLNRKWTIFIYLISLVPDGDQVAFDLNCLGWGATVAHEGEERSMKSGWIRRGFWQTREGQTVISSVENMEHQTAPRGNSQGEKLPAIAQEWHEDKRWGNSVLTLSFEESQSTRTRMPSLKCWRYRGIQNPGTRPLRISSKGGPRHIWICTVWFLISWL